MTAEARSNGWRGFDGIGTKVPGGYVYYCDGMPTLMGCGAELTISVRFKRVGLKKTSGWLVCYGRDDEGGGDDGKGNDLDVVLTFCPRCAAVVREQDRKLGRKEVRS